MPKVDSTIIKIKPSPEDGPLKVARVNRGRTPGDEDLFSKMFFKIVKAGFSQPRKQLVNNLSSLAAPAIASPSGAGGRRETQKGKKEQEGQGKKGKKGVKEKIKSWLLKNNIQPSQRAETLTISDWINLTNTFK